jgi:hypothetical protein
VRIDEKGKEHTLDEDIWETWKAHGWQVVSERVTARHWIIEAKPLELFHSAKEEKGC